MGIILTVLCVALLIPAAAEATFAGRNGQVAYVTYNLTDGETLDHSLSTAPVRRAGKGSTLFTCRVQVVSGPDPTCPLQVTQPSWSADGRLLAYDAGFSVAVRDMAGGAAANLPRLGEDVADPAFSPTGTRVVFQARTGRRWDLYVVRRATGQARLLARAASQADWSSRDQIAFVRGERVYSVRPDGSGLRRLTSAPARHPSWAPSGRTLLYEGPRLAGYAVRADGRRNRRVLNRCSSPLVSPDAKQVLCGSDQRIDRRRLRDGKVLDGQFFDGYMDETDAVGFSEPAWQAAPR